MTIETFLLNHRAETDRLARRIDEFREQGRTSTDYVTYRLFKASVDTLANLGVRAKAIRELREKLDALKAEISQPAI